MSDQANELRQVLEESRRLREQQRKMAIRQALASAGRKLGARNPERLWRMVEDDQVAFDDAGQVSNADVLVTDLASSDSYLFEPTAEQDRDAHGRFSSTRSAPTASSPKGWPINEQLRSTVGGRLDRQGDSAAASREINDALRAATGRAQPGRRT
jgi:hypothetical protein